MTRPIATAVAAGALLVLLALYVALGVSAVGAEPTPTATVRISAATPPAPSATTAASASPAVQLTPRPPKTGGGRNVEPERVDWQTVVYAAAVSAIVAVALTSWRCGGSR